MGNCCKVGESVEQIANRLVVGRAADQLLAASVVGTSLESRSSLEVHVVCVCVCVSVCVVTEDRRSWRLDRLTGGTLRRAVARLA